MERVKFGLQARDACAHPSERKRNLSRVLPSYFVRSLPMVSEKFTATLTNRFVLITIIWIFIGNKLDLHFNNQYNQDTILYNNHFHNNFSYD